MHKMNTRTIATSFRCAMIVSISLLATSCAQAQAPTREIVEKAMAASWEKPATASRPKSTFKLNSIKFGKAQKATLVDVQVNGIPEGATVTPALADFTVRTYYSNETQAVRRVREVNVYTDKFGEWAVMIGQRHGEDETTAEPAQKK